MDKFKNRLKYYLIGLAFGTLIVYFMFGNRGCSWLPANRVKNMIGEKEIVVGDSILAIMQCATINNDDIYNLLKSDGEVEFSESETQTTPKVYHLTGEKEGKTYYAKFALYEEKELSEVVAVGIDGATCSANVSNSNKSTVPLPHDDVIQILESNEFRVLTKAECQMETYNLSEELVFAFHKTATINIEKSQPRLSPNPEYVMEGEIESNHYAITYQIGENRTRIINIQGTATNDCED